MSSRPAITRHPVHCSYDADVDVLYACEFGAVPENRMSDQHLDISESLRFYLRRRGGIVMGFRIAGLTSVAIDACGHDLWDDPRFSAPGLGLRNASVGEIVLRARTDMAGRSTADVVAIERGRRLLSAQDYEAAEAAFREALDAGLMRARVALVAALCGQGRYSEAYDHARIFTEVAPRNSWAWAWLGRTCVEVGAPIEAQNALRRAVALERKGSYQTPAHRVLRTLEH